MNKYNPMKPLINKMNTEKPKMEFDASADYKNWREVAYYKLVELTGYNRFHKVDPELNIEYKKEYDNYFEIRFTMMTEENCEMPCYLLIPKGVKNPSLMICIQGHVTSMENSLGRDRWDRAKEDIEEGSDFAIQAINHNMAALCMDQRGMGERKENKDIEGQQCYVPTMTELLMGRTMVGARVWDISRAIDAIEDNFSEINAKKIYIMGHSGGGSTSFYATCLEPRIKAVIPSCSMSSYSLSIAISKHCVCNHIPHIREFFEMGDLAGVIAPRPIVAIAGNKDTVFPIEGIYDAYKTVKSIYTSLGCEENCSLVVGEGGHHFYPELAWSEFLEVVNRNNDTKYD